LAFVFEILLLVLFFHDRTSFPRILAAYFIILLIVSAIQMPIYGAIPNVDQDALAELRVGLIRDLIPLSIWVPYLFVSRRVKNTFRNRRKRPVPAAIHSELSTASTA
jgi:hypothetical protein